MNKKIKLIALCLAVLAFAALFTGCDYLDELKANHAILSEDKETISFRGETYKKLPDGENLYISQIYTDNFNDISITDADVPVLLSTTLSHSCTYDSIKDIFSVYINVSEPVKNSEDLFLYYTLSTVVEAKYYCNEKDYDMYTKAIKNNTLDFIGVEYEIINNDGWFYTLEALSEDFSKEIFTHIQNSEQMTEDAYEEVMYRAEYSESLQSGLYKCDADGVVAQYLNNITIERIPDGNSYLVDYNTEKAVKLSEKSCAELKDEYFYGSWSDTTYDTENIGIIGGADGETGIFVTY